jgi:hypothetical protein
MDLAAGKVKTWAKDVEKATKRTMLLMTKKQAMELVTAATIGLESCFRRGQMMKKPPAEPFLAVINFFFLTQINFVNVFKFIY